MACGCGGVMVYVCVGLYVWHVVDSNRRSSFVTVTLVVGVWLPDVCQSGCCIAYVVGLLALGVWCVGCVTVGVLFSK